ncbi:flagellar hook-length control protein FliK [Idiomarina piscisalsi]|uniref:Flagellar hook-length control protein FliK n=1 Tax=Idiomarina piscisalsi TaxID=1096243 RepID=A0ABN5ARD8_9GAMM|nr:flagellar hook-length control protein FliK [Idiomarina piscisalsi]ASG66254.1 flagellar hook-length control protein FliK [Idiomarina piscisalsi]
MADITQLLQQMLNAPERSMARIDKQNVATLARILTGANTADNQSASTVSKPTLQIPASILTPQTGNKAQQTSQPQIQGASWQWPNPPKALLAQLPAKLASSTQLRLQISMPQGSKPVVQIVISQPTPIPQAQPGQQKQVTQAPQGSTANTQVGKVEIPITQLPPKLVKALLSSTQASQLLNATQNPGATQPADKAPLNVAQPIQLSRGIAIKQAHQLSPQQFQQALQTLITQMKAQLSAQPSVPPSNAANASLKIPELSALIAKINTSVNTATTSGANATNTTSANQTAQAAQTAATLTAALRSPSNAIEQLIKVVLQQQPSGESMQRPEALQRWVSDWFAARPVSVQSSQQMGSLGQMLMTLLGLSLQQNSQQQSTAQTSLQSLPKQFTQALIQQVLNPSPDVAGDVRERINQLLLQLPQQQLQRLLQLFTGVLNSAQSAQARLQDSPMQQPEYFILLPTDPQKAGQNELLIRPEREPDTPEQEGRTLWLFTLRFELEATGALLVKGRYHPQGSSVDFYAESPSAQNIIEKHLEQLEKRLSDLEVNSVKFRVQQGRIPETLATQQSGIIRVKV